jgi:hypothetical protein
VQRGFKAGPMLGLIRRQAQVPAKSFHEFVLHELFNAATPSWAFQFHQRLQPVIYFLIRPLGSDGDSATDAIIRRAFVSGRGTPAIVYDHSHLSSLRWHFATPLGDSGVPKRHGSGASYLVRVLPKAAISAAALLLTSGEAER